MNKHSAYGFILFAVLIFLQIFSLISIYTLTYVSSALKDNSMHWTYIQTVSQANQILQRVESEMMTGTASCLIPVISAVDLSHKPLAWWELNACSNQNAHKRYYYVVEPLASDNCGFYLTEPIRQRLTVEYNRITLYVSPETAKGVRLILQSTITKPGNQRVICQNKPYQVYLGRQMWREI